MEQRASPLNRKVSSIVSAVCSTNHYYTQSNIFSYFNLHNDPDNIEQ